MLNGKELREKVNSINERVLNGMTYLDFCYGSSEDVTINLTPNRGHIMISSNYGRGKTEYVKKAIIDGSINNIKERYSIYELKEAVNDIEELLSMSVKQIEEVKVEDELNLVEIEDRIKNIETEIQGFLKEKIIELQKLLISKKLIEDNISKEGKVIDILKFNVNEVETDNINTFEESEKVWREDNVENKMEIKNKVFSFHIDMRDDESWKTGEKRKAINYRLYLNVKGNLYTVDRVDTHKKLYEYEKYIENLKKRYSKYFQDEVPTIPMKVYEKAIKGHYTIGELKAMGYNVE